MTTEAIEQATIAGVDGEKSVTLGIRFTQDLEAFLTYNGEDVTPEAKVTLPARAIADLACQVAMWAGKTVGTSRRTRKTVGRDELGRIMEIVEEPIL